MLNVEKIREDFPIFKENKGENRLVYLDSAATSQKPYSVIETLRKFYSYKNANAHRGLYKLSEEATEAYEEARKAVAKFINAKPEEIVFTKNATEALNLIMYGYGLKFIKKGEKITTTLMEHHSSFIPWQVLAKKKKAKLEILGINKDGFVELDEKKIKDSKFLGIVHASNVLGKINDIKKFSQIVREEGGIIAVDGSQAAPHIKIDVKKLDVDFYAFTGHKMLAPNGIGILYGKYELLEKMDPLLFGGGMVSNVELNNTNFAKPPLKFEGGTQNIAGALGLLEALKYIKKIGIENIYKHDYDLLNYAIKRLKEIDKINFVGPADNKNRIGIISFNISNLHPHDVAFFFNEKNVALRAGYHCAQPLHKFYNLNGSLRASFYIYNGFDDIDKLIEAIEFTIKKMC